MTYSRFGIRGINGEKLNPGDSIVVRGDNGKEIPMWVDKKTAGYKDEVFDIARNYELLESFHTFMARVDACTFPSRHLGEWYEKHWGVTNWYIFPNSVVPEHYPQVELAPHEGVRIIWQGGMSHDQDWHPIKDAVLEVAKKYPQAKFVMWGNPYSQIMKALPEDQIEYIPWMSYDAYKPWRVLVDADINLCPLIGNMFNRCKSAIKWYEASILKTPEVTLAANVIPYNEEMVDGETGLLYSTPEEFAEKLGNLIENAELRTKLGENAKKWVLNNRHYLKTVSELADFYDELRKEKIAKFEPKIISAGVLANGNHIR